MTIGMVALLLAAVALAVIIVVVLQVRNHRQAKQMINALDARLKNYDFPLDKRD